MNADVGLEVQRRILEEFSKRGWEYDLQSARKIADSVSREGNVDADKLAKLVRLSSLSRTAPTRSQVQVAIGSALRGLDFKSEETDNMRILFVSAGPIDEAALRLDAEHRDIRERLRKSTGRDAISFEVALAARPTDLIDEINRFKPSVLHLSGHGSAATGLALEDENGLARDVSGDQLKSLVAVANPGLRLVVLNSCESAIHAQPLVDHVDAAIGMVRTVDDDAARVFAAQLYSSLAEGASLALAFEQARLQVDLAGIPESDIPQLFARRGFAVDQLTLV